MFDLLDKEGCWIACVAMGRNAMNSTLKTGAEVVLYNVSGRGPIGSAAGAMWLFKDAMVVPVGSMKGQLDKNSYIEIRAKGS